jgi:hypothetical protein
MLYTKLATFLVALSLVGCASVRQIDNQVKTLSTLKSLPVAGYKFERLPSQQAPDQVQNQAALEAMAEQALLAVGMQRNDAKPGYSVQVGAVVNRVADSGWRDPFFTPGSLNVGFGHFSVGLGGLYNMGFGGRGRGHFGTNIMIFPGVGRMGPPQLNREVSVVMRDLSTTQVVYETSAQHMGPWMDDNKLLPVLFQAALSGFPVPPSERRIVNIPLDLSAPAKAPI